MSDKPKRRWFRYHLLTAVLTTFAMGGLLWANVRLRHTAAWESMNRLSVTNPEWIGVVTLDALVEWGWPATAYSEGHAFFYTPRIHRLGLLVDAGTALALLLVIAFVSESILRRREGHKP